MKGLGRKVSGAFKKMTGGSSSRSRGGSTSYTPKPTPTWSTMDYEEEEQYEEMQAEPQTEVIEIDAVVHRTSTCEMIVNDKATPSSRTEASSTPEPSIRTSSSKQVCTKTSLTFGMKLDGITSFPLRSIVFDSSPSNFFALCSENGLSCHISI